MRITLLYSLLLYWPFTITLNTCISLCSVCLSFIKFWTFLHLFLWAFRFFSFPLVPFLIRGTFIKNLQYLRNLLDWIFLFFMTFFEILVSSHEFIFKFVLIFSFGKEVLCFYTLAENEQIFFFSFRFVSVSFAFKFISLKVFQSVWHVFMF